MVTVEDVRHWAARPHDASQAFRFGAYLRSGGALVGAAGLRRRSVEPNGGWEWVDVSYWLAKSATRLGYATEATRRLALHAFDDLASPRVEVRTEPANSASARDAFPSARAAARSARPQAPFGLVGVLLGDSLEGIGMLLQNELGHLFHQGFLGLGGALAGDDGAH